MSVRRQKRFDAVEFQRRVREELSREYLADPEEFVRALRKKYGESRKRKAATR